MSIKVIMYTDGACRGNPGPGGWGVVLRYLDKHKMLKGYDPDTTNNRMELKAVIEGLKALQRSCEIDLYTDSKYVMQGINEWLVNWKRNGWKTGGPGFWNGPESQRCGHPLSPHLRDSG